MTQSTNLKRTLALLVVGLIAGCASSPSLNSAAESGSHTRVKIVASTTQLADFARVIGGEHVAIVSLAKPGLDPHEFQESPADMEALRNADLVTRNGVGLDAWLDPLLKSSDSRAAVIDTSTGIALRTDSGQNDPHVWANPKNAQIMVAAIANKLVDIDPKHATDYQAAFASYKTQLNQLDADITAQFASLTTKKFVTTHDSLGYFIDHFGLEYVGSVIPSFDTNSEVTAQQINELVTSVKRSGVRAIFTESSLPAKAAKALADQAHVRVVDGADALYGDSLGLPGSSGDTYLKMMRHNANAIASNL